MKVCVIGTRGFPQVEGGVEKHCESLYTALAKKENIEIILFRRKAYIKDTSFYKNIKFIDLPSTKIKGLETVIHSFFSTIKAIMSRPDIIHFHNIGPAMFIPLVRIFKISTVLTYHSPNYEHEKWGWLTKKLLFLCEKIALRYANKIIFVNSYQMMKYSNKIKEKSIYIPNGIAKPAFSKKCHFLEKLSIFPGKYILSVGRITPEKDYDTLIKGYRTANLLGYKLVIAGGVGFENIYMKTLEKLCIDIDVVFTGTVFGNDLSQLYSNAAVYVLASKNEGFPLALLEAMSYELDVLVSDIPATHLVKLNKEDYFSLGNYKELGKKLKIKIQNTKKRKYELADFDWNKIADKVFQIYILLLRQDKLNME